jgi:muconate cycloisomerase
LSFGDVTSLEIVVVKVVDENGLYGWGEAAVLGGPTWSEESAESIFATLNRFLIPLLLHAGVDGLERLRSRWDARVRGNAFAKAALEMALTDLRARTLGVPVAELLGGIQRTRIPLSWSLAAPTLEVDLSEGTEMVAKGHRIFKIKVAHAAVGDDIRRVRTIREVLGGGVSLRVDANQGWSRREAFMAAAGLADLALDFIEQPLVRGDEEGMALLQKRCDFPLMADESVTNLREAVRLASLDAARVFSIKVTKHGGIMPAMYVAALARALSIGCYMGSMIETGIGTAAYCHVAAALPVLEYGCELFGPLLLRDDILTEPIVYEPGHVVVPGGTGLGIEVDAEKLTAHARPDGYHLHVAS